MLSILRSIHKNSFLPRYSYIRILSCESATPSRNPTFVGYKPMCSCRFSAIKVTNIWKSLMKLYSRILTKQLRLFAIALWHISGRVSLHISLPLHYVYAFMFYVMIYVMCVCRILDAMENIVGLGFLSDIKAAYVELRSPGSFVGLNRLPRYAGTTTRSARILGQNKSLARYTSPGEFDFLVARPTPKLSLTSIKSIWSTSPVFRRTTTDRDTSACLASGVAIAG